MKDKNLLHQKLAPLYQEYTETFKPLLAEVEAIYEYHPDTILNEIRAFNDHISRCYWKDISEEKVGVNVTRAEGHMKRALFDCLKYINVYYCDYLKNFEEKNKYVDLDIIDNGLFYVKYRDLKQKLIDTKTQAKKIETINPPLAFDLLQDANDYCMQIEKHINDNHSDIGWAKRKYTRKRITHLVLQWIIPIAISLIGTAATIYPQKARDLLDKIF